MSGRKRTSQVFKFNVGLFYPKVHVLVCIVFAGKLAVCKCFSINDGIQRNTRRTVQTYVTRFDEITKSPVFAETWCIIV